MLPPLGGLPARGAPPSCPSPAPPPPPKDAAWFINCLVSRYFDFANPFLMHLPRSCFSMPPLICDPPCGNSFEFLGCVFFLHQCCSSPLPRLGNWASPRINQNLRSILMPCHLKTPIRRSAKKNTHVRRSDKKTSDYIPTNCDLPIHSSLHPCRRCRTRPPPSPLSAGIPTNPTSGER